jgi:ABC-type glycerol-3-phosphate transport system substrate-binding protein
MRKTRITLFAGAVLAGLAACSALPSEAHDPAKSDAGYSSNGVYVGSGHEEAVETTSASTASDSTTQRGGHGFGSGN